MRVIFAGGGTAGPIGGLRRESHRDAPPPGGESRQDQKGHPGNERREAGTRGRAEGGVLQRAGGDEASVKVIFFRRFFEKWSQKTYF